MNDLPDPFTASQVDSSGKRSPSRLLRIALPLLGVFVITLIAGKVATSAFGEYLPESWTAKTDSPSSRCNDARCVSGMTSCGLPESCFVEPLDCNEFFYVNRLSIGD